MRWAFGGLILAASVASGSWLGLHPEYTDEQWAEAAREAERWVHDRWSSAPWNAASAAPDADEPPGATADTSPEAAPPESSEPSQAVEVMPFAPFVETGNAPGLEPWPRLNPEASIAKAWRLAEGPHRKAGDHRRLVTLTFDDGPFPETTPKVLELLAKYDVRATFFVIGRYLDGNDDRARATRRVLKKIVDAGHLVGNHTYDHALLTAISHTQVLEQIDRSAASIERVIGKRPFLFRPPFGQLDDFGEEASRARRLDLLLWNMEAQDMERTDVRAMFSDLVRQLTYTQGGVVLLHDIRWTSVDILKQLLVYLDARRYDPERPDREGYEIVDLPTYLRAVEESPPQLGARDPGGLKRRAKAKPRVRPKRIAKPNEI
ncbi:MAG TPA: polysaccharide deacetylase family protein [Labilithrix sp.]|nr:polysaccharide deacetylase family protein [Labilithrix sp.]